MALDLEGFNDIADIDTDPDETIIEKLRFDDALEIPFKMTDLNLWANYCNEDLYQLDKKVREFLKLTAYDRRSKGQQKTAVPLIFLWIFGRQATPADSQVCVTLHKLMKYYCTRYTGSTMIMGTRFSRVYYFSRYACSSKRPMSLRLRLEERNDPYAYQEYGVHRDKRAQPRRRDSVPSEPDNGECGVQERGKDA